MRELYQKALSAKDNREKGMLFEDFLRKFFGSIEGFEVLPRPVRTSETDIDIVIANKSDDPFLMKLGPIITIQAKNYDDENPINWHVIADSAIQASMYKSLTRLVIVATTSHLSKKGKTMTMNVQVTHNLAVIVLDRHDWEEFFNENMSPKDFLINKILKFPSKIF